MYSYQFDLKRPAVGNFSRHRCSTYEIAQRFPFNVFVDDVRVFGVEDDSNNGDKIDMTLLATQRKVEIQFCDKVIRQ